jgi:CubicO group peptidase (beta-lactamase class C family)
VLFAVSVSGFPYPPFFRLETSWPCQKRMLRPRTGYSEATFAQIMNMQAGIRYRYTPDDPDADPKASQMGTPEYRRASFEDARHYRANGIVRKLENEPEAFGINDFLLTLKERDRKDGSVLYYADINSPAAALILERVTNRSFPDLLRQYWGNLGAESNAYLLHDAQGTALANSGLFATGRDLARAAYAVLNNGSVGNRQLFSERFSEKLKTLPSRDKFNPQSNLWGSLPAGLAYHYFTVALPTPSGTQVLGGGAFGQWFLVDFARRNVLVKLSSDLFVTSERNKMDIFALQSLSEALPLLQ